MSESIDTVIVGAGQAGLAVSYYLTQQGRAHVVLERSSRTANAWRNQRWDSFTFVTPNWMTRLPGTEDLKGNPDGFMSRAEIISFFDQYAERFKLPVRHGMDVTAVTRDASSGHYLVNTNHGSFQSANVVVATGLFQRPKIPAAGAELSTGIKQLHSSEYRNPQALPMGAVLLVGSGQTGCQIAEELYQSGRKVYLSIGSTGRVPRRYRGKDIFYWLEELGAMRRTVGQLKSPRDKFRSNPHVSGARGGHTLNLHQFARDGVVLLGHLIGAAKTKVAIAPDIKESLAKADRYEADFLKTIDDHITEHGLEAPDEALVPLRDGYDAEVIRELDLIASNVQSVIWASGYTFDFRFVDLPVLDADGYPIQDRGVTGYPGLYFAGLPWMHSAKSGLLFGVGEDAAFIAAHLATQGRPTGLAADLEEGIFR
jgi:putative flavoprotein involved in K+ transport